MTLHELYILNYYAYWLLSFYDIVNLEEIYFELFGIVNLEEDKFTISYKKKSLFKSVKGFHKDLKIKNHRNFFFWYRDISKKYEILGDFSFFTIGNMTGNL